MKLSELTTKILNGGKVDEILSPENYVFKERELTETFLIYYERSRQGRERKKFVTKTQLRKHYNEFKNVHNDLVVNTNITKEEFDNKLKRLMILFPIIKSKRTFSKNLIDLIEAVLKATFEANKKDVEQAVKYYTSFIQFYETLVAYSRN